MDNQEIPLKFKRGLLHVPLRESTGEELQLLPIFDITSDTTWDPKDLDDEDPSTNHFKGDSMHHTHVTKLGKVIGTEDKVDLTALVHAVKSACQVGTHHPELTDEEEMKTCRGSQEGLGKKHPPSKA